MKQFKGVVEKRLPELLQGEPKDALSLRQTIKAIQKIGLAKDLDAKEFRRLHEVLTDEGRADSDDENSVHPFDLLFAYYYDNDQRCHNDLCVAFDESFNIESRLEELLSRLDAAVGTGLFPADNVGVPSERNQAAMLIAFT